MDKPIDAYWGKRLERLKAALENNGFDVRLVADEDEARRVVVEELIPASGAKTIAFGGSTTISASGIYDAVKKAPGLSVIDTYDRSVPREEIIERRRQGLLSDFYLTGTNAVTEDGRLVNLDMIGNRVAALHFGPRKVAVVIGRNKLVGDLTDALRRVKDYAAPTNAMRLDMKTPCVKTGRCEDCKSPERICNVWTITEKSFPKGRVTIVLVDKDLGF